jgi:hypothetical protein
MVKQGVPLIAVARAFGGYAYLVEVLGMNFCAAVVVEASRFDSLYLGVVVVGDHVHRDLVFANMQVAVEHAHDPEAVGVPFLCSTYPLY